MRLERCPDGLRRDAERRFNEAREIRAREAEALKRCYAENGRNDVRVSRQTMSETHRITVDPRQCGGQSCLRGLRIRVRDVLDVLAAGADRAEILADYPLLEEGDITAALEYAARQSDHPVLRVA
jgi:uncharacterized protein (DUF433 family)